MTVCQVTIVTASVWLDRCGSCDSVSANPDTRLLLSVKNKKPGFLSSVTGSADSVRGLDFCLWLKLYCFVFHFSRK